MANPVIISDVAARWRPLSTQETAVGEALLIDAWAILLHSVPDIEARLDAAPATLDVNIVRAVVSSMVLRVLRNPDGKRIEQIDDYSYTRDDSRASGTLYVAAEELEMLTPSSATGAFSIRPSYVADDLASMNAWWDAQ